MKRKRDSLSGNFQLVVFTILYILSSLFLYGVFIWFSAESRLIFNVFFTLGFLIAGTIIWAFLYVLFSIPQELAGSSDYIKNKILTGEIDNTAKFADELSAFLIDFFDYTFFDIHYTAINTDKKEVLFSSKKITNIIDWKNIERTSAESPSLQKNGKVKIDNITFYCYTTPIYFNNKYFGFFTVFTKQRLGKHRLIFLTDLEENFIDDQLLHVIYRNRELSNLEDSEKWYQVF